MSTSEIKLTINSDDENTIRVCRLYWEIDENGKFVHTVAKIARDHGIKSYEVTSIASTYSIVSSEIDRCRRCNKGRTFNSRSDFQLRQSLKAGNFVCADCQEMERTEKLARQKVVDEEKARAIRQNYAIAVDDPIEVNNLSLKKCVYLLTFIRAAAVEDFSFCKPLASLSLNDRLSPTRELDISVIRFLYQSDLIDVHPDSSVTAFDFSNGVPNKFFLDRVSWLLPHALKIEQASYLTSNLQKVLQAPPWPEHWRNEIMPIWRELALNECLEFLSVSLGDHNLDFNPGEKTFSTFMEVLNLYSVSQVYSMIWRASKDAAAYYQRGSVSKIQAANSVVGAIQRFAERANASKWEVASYRRDRRCPRSIISEVLFTTALKGEDGFYLPPIETSLHHYEMFMANIGINDLPDGNLDGEGTGHTSEI